MKKRSNLTPEELEKVRETIARAQALALELLRQRLRYAGAMRQGIGAPLMPERGRPCLWLVN